MLTPLRIRLPTQTEADFLERYRAYLSRGGIFIATHSPKPKGTELAFELVLKDGSRVFRGEGVVLKARGEDQPAPPGMMIRFRKLDAKSKAMVDSLAGLDLPLPAEIDVSLEFTGEADAPDAAMESPTEPTVWVQAGLDGSDDGPPVSQPTAEAPRPRRRVSLEVPSAEVAPTWMGVGIDIGTRRTRVARVALGHATLVPEGEEHALPSALAIGDAGELLIGSAAAARENAWYGWTRAVGLRADSPLAQKLFGEGPFPLVADPLENVAFQIAGQAVSAQNLLGQLLSQLYASLQETLQTHALAAVFSVPSYFGHRQRASLRAAAETAGFKVLRLIHTTSAAALGMGHGRGLPRRRMLVCDLGAGSAEAAVVELTGNDIESAASLADPTADLDAALRLTQSVLDEAGLQPQGLDEVVLVGGTGNTPEAHSRWESAFGKKAFSDSVAEGLAARGAALLAHGLAVQNLGQSLGPPFATAGEVLSCPIETTVDGLGTQRLFERRTRLPAEKSFEARTEEGQPLRVALHQGRGTDSPELLGVTTFKADRAGPCTLRFSLDTSGLMHVTVQPATSTGPQPLLIDLAAPLPANFIPAPVMTPEPPERGGLFKGLKRLFKGG